MRRPNFSALSFPAQVALWAAISIVLLPWTLRVYAWYWDTVFGHAGHFLETWLPIVR